MELTSQSSKESRVKMNLSKLILILIHFYLHLKQIIGEMTPGYYVITMCSVPDIV